MLKENLTNINKILKNGSFNLDKFLSEIENIKKVLPFLSQKEKKYLLKEIDQIIKTIEYKQNIIQDKINKLKQKSKVEAKYYGRKKTK